MQANELESKLSSLKRARGAAALDGRKFDSTAIDAVQAEIDARSDADGELARRKRETADVAFHAKLKAQRVELGAVKAAYLEDTKQAQEHVRGAAAAISRMLAAAEKMARLSHEITGDAAPTALFHSDLKLRAGNRMSSIMGTIPGAKLRLGGAQWHSGPYQPDQDWHAAETALLDRQLNPIVNGEIEHGKE